MFFADELRRAGNEKACRAQQAGAASALRAARRWEVTAEVKVDSHL